MNTDLLRSLLEVARCESYTRAADALYLSQPTVYQHLRSLERLLQVQVVRQAGKRVVVTPEGRALLPHVVRLLAEEEKIAAVAAARDDLVHSRLSIVAGSTFGETIIPGALARFRRSNPGVAIRLELYHDLAEVDRALLALHHDAGFHANGVSRSGLTKRRVIEDGLIVIVPPKHELADRDAVSAVDLVAEGVISYGHPYGVRAAVDAWAAAQKVEVPSRLELESQGAIVRMVAAGGGIAVLSAAIALPYLRSGDVVGLALRPPLSRGWYFVHPSHHEVPDALHELLSEMRANVEEMYGEVAHLFPEATKFWVAE